MSNESRITDYGSPITHNRLRITDYPKVSIIILNWNGWNDTIECLESLYQITYPNYGVIVVDNGSEDESIAKIKDYAEGKIKVESKFFEYSCENKPIKIIEYTREEAEAGGGKEGEIPDLASNRKLIIIKNEKNYGFAEGNNIGMRYALSSRTDYILILNNDIVVAPDFLTELHKAMDENVQAGIAGPTCYYYDKPNTIWYVGTMINWWTRRIRLIGYGKQDTGQYQRVTEVDSVSGCAMLVRRRVLEKISLFDPRFPFGNEDYEFCTRACREHFKVIHVPNSMIWHKVSRSRRKLMNNREKRENLLKQIGGLRMEEWLWFFKTYSPSRLQYVSQNVFYFAVTLPWGALLFLKRHGLKATLARIRFVLREIKDLIRI